MRHFRLALGFALALLAACSPSEQTAPGTSLPQGDASAVVEALREPDPLVRAEALARSFRTLAPDALPQVRRAYSGGFFDLGDTELVLLAEWWARFDAPAALDWTTAEWQANANQVRWAILRAWARQDPEAALRMVESQVADSERALWLDAVLSGWEDSGKPGAFEYVRALPYGEDRQRAIATLARRKVLRDGVTAAFDWAESQPEDDDKFKLNLLRRVGSAGAEVDPVLASQRAALLSDGPYARGLLRRVGTRWAKRDGEAALRWLASQPPDRARDDAVGETFRTWVRWSRADALRFMGGPGREEPAYEPAVGLYALVISREDPVTAVEVAQALSDEEKRWVTTGRVWRNWWIEDEDAANAWFEAHESEIPEFYRERIRTIPDGVRKRKRERGRVVQP